MKVTATVILPAYVEVEVPDETSLLEIEERLKEQADLVWDSTGLKAIITECSIPELVD